MHINFIVEKDETVGMRLDSFCSEQLDGINRAQFKNGLQNISINGVTAKLSRRIQLHDHIKLQWENPIPTILEAENIPLRIVYEDQAVIAVNKAAGMVSHPAPGNWRGTLANALAFYRIETSPFKTTQQEFLASDLRAGIVHRLDKPTSGIIITARTPAVQHFLMKAFKKRAVKKLYIAIVYNTLPQQKGEIVTALFRDPRHRNRFAADSDLTKGKYARTTYRVLKSGGGMSLVLFRLYTGRTHQIRIHARFLGCPIVGDDIYGTRNQRKQAHDSKSENSLLLHSYKLGIPLPEGKRITLTAPVPKRFTNAMRLIEEQSE